MFKSIVLSALLGITSNSAYANVIAKKRQLAKRTQYCRSLGTDLNRVIYDLSFKGERTPVAKALGYFKKTLLVATNFTAKRAPETFSKTALLTPGDIGKISESRISEFKIVDSLNNEAFFSSSKKLPLGLELNCSNSVQVLSLNEFRKSQEGLALSESLKSLGCFEEGLPFIVSDQKVYSCNRFFNQSRIITFYFKKSPSQTNILTISLSELSASVGFFQRRAMESEVKKSLKSVPLIIERLK